jgi:hypothetical protein
MLDTRLEHPAAAIEALVSELKIEEPQTELWERLHAAAVRDSVEPDLAAAYRTVVVGHRLQQLAPPARAQLLMHASDFFLGALGDPATAQGFLLQTLEVIPGHPEAFSRLEQRLEAARDHLRLAELYALVAVAPPRPAADIARAAVNQIAMLTPKTPLSDEACKRLLALVPASFSILSVVESHCKKTDRIGLASALLEQALMTFELPKKDQIDLRRRLIELYLVDTGTREKAMPHIEALFEHDPVDALARTAAEKLLSHRTVGSRAAAVLRESRRHRSGE